MLILDEIQTGLGRLGGWWGADRAGVRPDILLAGKGLGGGLLAVSAVIATSDAFAGLNADPFVHSSTFAGSPLASAVATATIRTMQEEGTVERARELGEILIPRVRARGGRPSGLARTGGPGRRFVDRHRLRRGRGGR